MSRKENLPYKTGGHRWQCWSVQGHMKEWRCPECGTLEKMFGEDPPPSPKVTCEEAKRVKAVRKIQES